MPRKSKPYIHPELGVLDNRRQWPLGWGLDGLKFCRTCEYCGQRFVSYRSIRKPKFCGDTCRQRSHRGKRAP